MLMGAQLDYGYIISHVERLIKLSIITLEYNVIFIFSRNALGITYCVNNVIHIRIINHNVFFS